MKTITGVKRIRKRTRFYPLDASYKHAIQASKYKLLPIWKTLVESCWPDVMMEKLKIGYPFIYESIK